VRHLRLLRLAAVASSIAVLLPAQFVNVEPAGAAGDTSFALDLGARAAPIPNLFSNMTFYQYRPTWTRTIVAKPANYINTTYPWLRTAYLQYGTGGCYTASPPICAPARDLLADPAAGPASAYDFTPIHDAARNILRQGLKPYIDLGTVPVRYSSAAAFSYYFQVNIRPPADYRVYHDYISAMLQSLVSEFGLNEVRTWQWGVVSEYESLWSFQTADQQPASTASAYFKLYDYTVGALEEVLGKAFVNVGAHCMCVIRGFWDPRDLLTHAVRGPNLYNGGPNTQLDFVTVSFYEQKLGAPGDVSNMGATVSGMRDRANQLGLLNLPIGVDEGGTLNGYDNRTLMHYATAMTWQGSWYALLFKRLLDLNISWFSPLTLSTQNLVDGIRPSYVNVIELASRLAGSNRLTPVKSGNPVDPGDQVRAVGGYNPLTKTAYIMVFNHNPNGFATTAEPAAVNLSHIKPATGTTVNVKQWIVDDTHGNFWPAWQRNAAGCQVPDNGYVYSKYSAEVPMNLTAPYASCWTNRQSKYQSLSTMRVVSTTDLPTRGKALTLSSTLGHHGVTLYEITNAAIAP
jgi:hypothetical protein